MSARLRVGFRALWLCAVFTATAAAFDIEPLDEIESHHFYAPRHYQVASLDPTGRFVASWVQEDGRFFVVVFDAWSLRKATHELAFRYKTLELGLLGWMDRDSILLSVVDRLHDGSWRRRTLILDVETGGSGGEFEIVVHRVVLKGRVVDTLPEQDETILLQRESTSRRVYRVEPRRLVVDESAGTRPTAAELAQKTYSTIAVELPASPMGRLVVHDGEVVAFVSADGSAAHLWHRLGGRSEWRRVMTFDSVDDLDVEPAGLTPDGRRLVVRSNRDHDTWVLREFDQSARGMGRVLFEHPTADVAYPIYQSGSSVIVGAAVMEAGLPRNYYFDTPGDGLGWLEERFEGSVIHPIGRSLDGQQILVFVEGPRNPGAFYHLDMAARKLVLFGETMPWLAADKLAPVERLEVQAEGGPVVEAFVSRPRGFGAERSAAKPHLVVVPHGGPIGVADDRTFDPVVQQLSNRGYAVLKVNYRGSGGYGKAFVEAGRREWGRGIEDDIDAAVDAVIARGWARADEMCIVGGSYGGYSALMTVIRRPDRYVCAAIINAVTDIPLLFSTSDYSHSAEIREIQAKLIGDPEKEYEALKARSPVFNAEKIRVPLLIAQSLEDRRVDLEHAVRLMAMLDVTGGVYEYMPLPGEGHSPSNDAYKSVFARIGSFLDDRFLGSLRFDGSPHGVEEDEFEIPTIDDFRRR